MKKIEQIGFVCPVLLFGIMCLIYGLPETSLFTKEVMIFQYVMTMITIMAVPAMLWYVRPERVGQKYPVLCSVRTALLCVITCIDVCSYFIVPNVVFFYIGVMTYLTMFLAREKKNV